MNDLIQNLKREIINLSNNKKFIHHEWFIKYHLEIVEKIALELCDIYKEANKDIVMTMVWFHDYGKILDFDNQYEMTQKEGMKFLLEIGFEREFATKVLEYVKIMDSKLTVDINEAPLEVKIVSSADGAAHLVGPFFLVYLQENHLKSLEELLAGNINKAIKDWERKIVLLEVKKAFKNRHKITLEQNGLLPDKFL